MSIVVGSGLLERRGEMKILNIIIVLFFFSIFSISPLLYGEIIVTKDGQAIEANITEKTEDTIWYEVDRGEIIEEIGIDILEIEKVLNDDGSASEYSPK